MFKRTVLRSLFSTSHRTLEHGFGRMNGTHALLSISRSDGHTSLRNFTLHRCRQPPTSTTDYCRGGQSARSLPIQARVPDVHPMTRRHTVLPPTGFANSFFSLFSKKARFRAQAMRPFQVKRSRYAVDGNTRYCHIQYITD